MVCKKITDIKPEQVGRARTGYQEIDWLYGFTRFPNKVVWGLPQSKISLWSGQSGTGKSRAAIALAKSISTKMPVLYFQNEADIGTFAGWVNGGSPYLYASDATDLQSQINEINRVAPKVVIIDSINQLEEYGNGTKTDIKRIIEGYNGIKGYRDIVKERKIHIIIIAQLNQDGTVKGSTTLTHLVDICFSLTHYAHEGSGLFTIKVGNKHRCGRTGKQFHSVWSHEEYGVRCISDYSLEDEVWCSTHGIAVRDLEKHFGITPELKKSLKNRGKRSKGKVAAPKVVAPKPKSSTLMNWLIGSVAGAIVGWKSVKPWR